MTARGLLLSALLLWGCYRSHLRSDPSDAAIDRDARDAAAADAARADAFESDAGPIACDALAVTGMALLDEGVTPRLVAGKGDEVGVVYVRTDGDPTRVVYERLDRTLTRITGPVTVATDSFTWAEIERSGDELLVAYGHAGDRESVMAHVTFDGVPTGRQHILPLVHPSIFQRSASDALLWVGFDMRTDNALALTHVTDIGALVHATVTIGLGRYGSGHHALSRGDGSHALGYSREGPPGARHGYVSVIDPRGALGPERLLDPDASDSSVTPVAVAGGLVIVRHDEELVLERTDPDTLERIDRVTFPGLDGSPIAAALADRLVVAHAASGAFRWDFFQPDLSSGERYEVSMPFPGLGSGSSVVAQRGALVFAVGLTDGPRASPWLVRIACVD